MEARAGVVTAVEVNGPIATPGKSKMFDIQSPTTWATILFVAAIIYLFLL